MIIAGRWNGAPPSRQYLRLPDWMVSVPEAKAKGLRRLQDHRDNRCHTGATGRMVKILECSERPGLSMMDIEDERNHMDAALSLRYRIGQPGTPAASTWRPTTVF